MGGLLHARQQLASRGEQHEIGDDEEDNQHHAAHDHHGQEAGPFSALAGIALHAMDNRFHISLDARSRVSVRRAEPPPRFAAKRGLSSLVNYSCRYV